MANRAKAVELACGDRERLSTCATASAREHAGSEALPHEASGRADAAVADKTGVDAGDVEGEVPPLAAAGHAPLAVDDTPEVGVVAMGPPPVPLAPPPTHAASRPPRGREARSRPRAQR